MPRPTNIVLCLLSFVLIACANDAGGGGGVEDPDGTCDASGTSIPLCHDYDADDDDVSFYMTICMGTWSDTTPCDRATACGACAQPRDGLDATTYYYAGSGPEAENAAACVEVGGSWIDEPSVTCE